MPQLLHLSFRGCDYLVREEEDYVDENGEYISGHVPLFSMATFASLSEKCAQLNQFPPLGGFTNRSWPTAYDWDKQGWLGWRF